jgi:hypothetical protein
MEKTFLDVNRLHHIRDNIEAMSKFHQVEVLRLLSMNSIVTLNENKYGVHINLTELPDNLIDGLAQYIHYVQNQETSLHQLEQQKESFKSTFFLTTVFVSIEL